MHLRRALILFAIVLGLAAVAASVSRPRQDDGQRTEQAAPPPESAGGGRAPTLAPGSLPADQPLETIVFAPDGKDTRRVPPDQGATVVVEVDEPGQVEIPDLGVSDSAEPLTPARFEIFTADAGSHEILFAPASGDDSRDAGTLVVEPDRG